MWYVCPGCAELRAKAWLVRVSRPSDPLPADRFHDGQLAVVLLACVPPESVSAWQLQASCPFPWAGPGTYRLDIDGATYVGKADKSLHARRYQHQTSRTSNADTEHQVVHAIRAAEEAPRFNVLCVLPTEWQLGQWYRTFVPEADDVEDWEVVNVLASFLESVAVAHFGSFPEPAHQALRGAYGLTPPPCEGWNRSSAMEGNYGYISALDKMVQDNDAVIIDQIRAASANGASVQLMPLTKNLAGHHTTRPGWPSLPVAVCALTDVNSLDLDADPVQCAVSFKLVEGFRPFGRLGGHADATTVGVQCTLHLHSAEHTSEVVMAGTANSAWVRVHQLARCALAYVPLAKRRKSISSAADTMYDALLAGTWSARLHSAHEATYSSTSILPARRTTAPRCTSRRICGHIWNPTNCASRCRSGWTRRRQSGSPFTVRRTLLAPSCPFGSGNACQRLFKISWQVPSSTSTQLAPPQRPQTHAKSSSVMRSPESSKTSHQLVDNTSCAPGKRGAHWS